jgi:tetratricopeptide (TPR) repeat protein
LAARLALIYRAAKRYDDALAAVDRALANVYGPRAFRLYDLKAGLLLDKGDRAGAKKTLEEAVAYAKRLPAAQTRASVVADFQKRLESMR